MQNAERTTQNDGGAHTGRSLLGVFTFALCVLSFSLSSCNWKVKPTYPGNRVAESLRLMLAKEYKLPVETRRIDNTLEAFFWRVGLLKAGETEMRQEAAEALEKALLCATRVALSTDAPLEFVQIKMADVMTGSTVSLWRYVPDIRDSMYQRIPEEEYYNRLVLEVDTHSQEEIRQGDMAWDRPLTFPEFLAKQVVFRAKRQSGVGLQVHEDLSKPETLTMIVDNWPMIEAQGKDKQVEIADLIERTTQTVMRSYRFRGFRGLVLQDARGAALKSWTL